MQKLAIHLHHYKRQQVAKLGAEGQRIIKNTLDNRIDFRQSKFNFQALTGHSMDKKSYTQAVCKICEDNGIKVEKKGGKTVMTYGNGKAVRKDANVLTGIVVTLDRETVEKWGVQRSREYFAECTNFLKGIFGNCVDDVVHTDEMGAGWHLHFYACPILNGKFDGKQMWRRENLISLHNDMVKHLQGKGFDVSRGTPGVNNYIESYKDYKRTLPPLVRTLQAVDFMTKRIEENARVRKASKGFLGIGEKEETVEVPRADYNNLLEMARQAQRALLELQEQKKRQKQADYTQKLEEELTELRDRAEEMENNIAYLCKALEEQPAKTIKAYKEEHKAIFAHIAFLKKALSDNDFSAKYMAIRREYIDKVAGKARNNPTRERERVKTKSRDEYTR